MTNTKIKDEKFEHSQEEFKKISDLIKNKAKELLEAGEILPRMLDFEYYEDDNEIEVDHVIKYPNGSTDNTTKTYYVEVQIIISDYR